MAGRGSFACTLAAVLLPLAAGSAAALPVAAPQAPAPKHAYLRVADLTAVTDASARRRIEFYADRVFQSLSQVAADDARAFLSGGALDPKVAATLRDAVARFVDACGAAGLDEAQTADILSDYHVARYQGETPSALSRPDGALDAALLVRDFSTARRNAGPIERDAYLSAIEKAGSDTLDQRLEALKGAPEPSRAADAVPAAAALLAEVTAESDPLTPEQAAILGRVTGQAPERRIVVEPGDTLGLIASAVYGESLYYRYIFDANRDRLFDPDTLRVGLELRLPPL